MWSDGIIVDRRTGEHRPYFRGRPDPETISNATDATSGTTHTSIWIGPAHATPPPFTLGFETRQQRALRLARAAAADHGAREHERPRAEPRPALVLLRPNYRAMPRRLAS